MCVYMCIYLYLYVYIYMFICIYICIYMCVYVCIYLYFVLFYIFLFDIKEALHPSACVTVQLISVIKAPGSRPPGFLRLGLLSWT